MEKRERERENAAFVVNRVQYIGIVNNHGLSGSRDWQKDTPARHRPAVKQENIATWTTKEVVEEKRERASFYLKGVYTCFEIRAVF